MRLLVRVLIVAWVITGLMATRDRIALWGNERALWADAVAQAPGKPRPWVNLGRQYALDGALGLAEDAYRRGMRAADAPGRSLDERVFGYGIGAANVALLRCKAGDVDSAVAVTAAALERRPAPTSLREVHAWLVDQQLPGHGRCLPQSSF